MMFESHDEVIHARGGFIYTSAHIRTRATVRPSAVLLFSACGRPFELSLPGRRETLQAASMSASNAANCARSSGSRPSPSSA